MYLGPVGKNDIYDTGLELTGTRILILPPKREEKSSGGILLVQDTREREERAHTTGILIGATDEALACKEMKGIKVGDTIFHARYAGDNVPYLKNGHEYKVLNAVDVIGKLTSMPDDPFRPAKTQREVGHINETVPV
jgi:co-chaperonin GroES (HSP10)